MLRDRLRSMNGGAESAGSTEHRTDVARPIAAALALTRLNDSVREGRNGRLERVSDQLRSACLASHTDPELHARLVRMWHLLESPESVLRWTEDMVSEATPDGHSDPNMRPRL